ncbi:O-antigen ligase family protein [Cryobacterium roopkundense]|uniref:O-antigen ligase n=1 Tax=Cryobacterium roopkundense TaxID=1001240 RepID=A0A7W9E5U4_9MICO|nr:O-antigen ligase family protein [Cryobacterium roopkundense]MBB5642774.1 O-antigen ligase [Cryobacterium roopkundense]
MQKRARFAPSPRTTSFPDATTFLTVYVVLLLAIPSNRSLADLGNAGALSVIWGLGAGVLWVIAWVQRSRPEPPQLRPVRVAVLVFSVAAMASYIAAMTRALPPDEVSVADTGLIRLLAWFGILFIAHDGITTLDRLLTLLRRLVVAAGCLGALGIAQFATKLSFVDLLPLPGLSITEGYASVETRGGLVRAAGTATHPLEYSLVLAAILPIALTLALRERHRSFLARWLPVALILIGLLLSGSRSAVVGILAGALVLLPTWSRLIRVSLALAGAALLGVIYLASPLAITNLRYMFLAVFDDPSAASRTSSLDLFSQLFLLNPVFGRGFGTFLPQYRILDNQYLLLLLEIGVVGLAAFVFLAVTAAVCAVRSGLRQSNPALHDMGFALAGSVASAGVLLALFDALSFPQSAGLLFLLFGLCGAFWRLSHPLESALDDPTSVGRSVVLR